MKRLAAFLLAVAFLLVSSTVLYASVGLGITSTDMQGNPHHVESDVNRIGAAADLACWMFLLVSLLPAMLLAYATGSAFPSRLLFRWLASYAIAVIAGAALAFLWLSGYAPDPVWTLSDLLKHAILR
jgi:hypothetical protein